MKKINIISLIVLLTVLGYVFYRNFLSNGVSNSTITVIITDSGFSMDKITIAKGTTITWVNQGERLHWPASNFHPLHNLYPAKGGCIGSTFDACRGLKKGEEFSFKLEEIGIWPMHDHLFPGMTMVVEVVDEKTSQTKISNSLNMENVDPSGFKDLPYDQQMLFIKQSADKDPASTWKFLKKSFIIDGQVVGNAHEFSHIIGNTLYRKFGLNGIKTCDTSFAFGCMHGVTEAMLLKEGVEKIKSIEEQCIFFFPPNETQDYTGCIHGMGHGLYSFQGGDLKEALADCDIISEPYRQYCYDGVFMENSFTPEGRMFDNKNPWKFCSDLNERYHRNCARYQSQVFLGALGGLSQIETVGKNCSLGPSTLTQETCYESLGYYTAQTHLGKVSDIWKSCEGMPNKKGVEICVTGAAKETIFQKYTDWENGANELCKKLGEPGKGECLDNIKHMIKR